MGADIFTGPLVSSGNMDEILSAAGQGQAGSVLVPDPNPSRGPSLFFMGAALPDPRFWFMKDKVDSYPGIVPAQFALPFLRSINQIPAALQVDNVAAAQNAVNGTAMTVAVAATGITLNVPIIPFAGFGAINGAAVVTTALALDFGFAFGNVTSGSTTVTVADSTMFAVGDPLVIGGVGNAGGTTCLLTNVASITDATTIVIQDAPLATNAAAPIGTGNLWGPSTLGYPTPTAALPFRAVGPGLFLDPAQSVARALRIIGTGGGCSGGTFLVSGYDIYGMAVSELVTVAAGASTGTMGKAIKYLVSVVPQFSDAQNYTVGTTDVYGFHTRSDLWEDVVAFMAGAIITASTGWVAAVTTNPATTTTGDVRGTYLAQTASNGSIVSLAMSGRRLMLAQHQSLASIGRARVTDTRSLFGVTQA